MKKVIIGFSGLLVLTFFIMLTVIAQNNDKETKKAKTEVSKDFSQCPSIAMGSGCSGSQMANCSATKSATLNCDASKCNEGKCDPATCQGGKCDPTTCQSGKCDPSTCKTNCEKVSLSMVSTPMNCNR